MEPATSDEVSHAKKLTLWVWGFGFLGFWGFGGLGVLRFWSVGFWGVGRMALEGMGKDMKTDIFLWTMQGLV